MSKKMRILNIQMYIVDECYKNNTIVLNIQLHYKYTGNDSTFIGKLHIFIFQTKKDYDRVKTVKTFNYKHIGLNKK